MTGVTVGCFLVSYLILWAFELTRLWFRLPWRAPLLVVLAVVTILTHGMFLYDRQEAARRALGHFTIPATFFDWSQIAAFGLGLAYLVLIIRRPSSVFGIFILPLVIGIIAASMLVLDIAFSRTGDAAVLWGYIHGGALSVAIVSVSLGFVVSIVRVWQQTRLKKKVGVGGPFRLPSLEYLDSFGRTCLIASTVCIATGLIGGVIMNSLRSQQLSWLEPGIFVSGLLLVWLISAITLEAKAFRQGTSRAVGLNLITFAMTVAAVIVVFANAHGQAVPTRPSDATVKAVTARTLESWM